MRFPTASCSFTEARLPMSPIHHVKKQAYRHRKNSGAAMVEALIVISFLVLGFMGLVYFKNLYLEHLSTLRLARASIIAHGMAGCEANYPAEWLSVDAQNQRADDALVDDEMAPPDPDVGSLPSTTPDEGSESRAGDVVAVVDNMPSEGGYLNEIAKTQVNGVARVTSQTNGEEKGFEGEVRSRSYVSCGDPIHRDTGWGDAFDYAFEAMSDLFDFEMF